MKNPAFIVKLDARKPETHRIQVSIESKTHAFPNLLNFPVWTPGSYLIREFSRHITNFSGAKKVAKNSWRANTGVKRVQYEAYCYEHTVRTSYLDNRIASLVGATLLPLLEGSIEVHLLLPKNWKFAASALEHKKITPGHWVFFANDDDQWIDSPIVAAAPGFGGQSTFRSKGKPHRISWIGIEPSHSFSKISSDIHKISDRVQDMFGGSPFDHYEFLLDFFPKAYGGLEHRDSQLSHFDNFEMGDPKRYEAFLALIAHEYFHAWNVKSLRPQALGPFNYFTENYTEDLWFAEGITSYFDDKLVLEAGLLTPESYRAVRLKDINAFKDGFPAIQRRSVAEGSFDAWIRYYRPDEDSPNTDTSYYVKGSQLGWCWDALLQKKTQKRWNLAKLLRSLWREFGIHASEPLRTARPGYTQDELFDFAQKTTGVDHGIVRAWVHCKKAMPWKEAAEYFKITYKEKISSHSAHFLGCNIVDREGKIFIANVFSGSSAEKSGIAVNDELLAIDDARALNAEHAQAMLKRKQPISTAGLLLCRAGKIFSADLKLRKHAGLGVDLE